MTTASADSAATSSANVESATSGLIAEIEQQFHSVSPDVFFIASRVLRRVLRNELEITSPFIKLPHRKSLVIDRDRLLWLVARDELGAEPNVILPARLILIARPEEDELNRWDRNRLQRYYWQLVFHARLDYQMQDSTASSRMSLAMLRERINRLGQSEFDEIRSVLRYEAMLLHPEDLRAVYAEFVAVYCELETFAPELLPLYFPSVTDRTSIRSVIQVDCPVERILQACTPPELAGESPEGISTEKSSGMIPVVDPAKAPKPSERRCRQRMRWGQRFHDQENSVRAALWFHQSCLVAPPNLFTEARELRDAEINTLSRRLQIALELTDDLTTTWRHIAEELVAHSGGAFWNANLRLLYDLQKVCLDHERETYRIDLWRWLRRFGRDPLKRPLPNQRIVLMSKHLASATRRLASVKLNAEDRKELSHLLHESAAAAERLMRRRLEPFVTHSLHDTGFVAESVVEEVAFEKMVEELLDGVVIRGFITLGDLRDAVSRNQLKMDDLSGSKEFLAGDALLQADQRLALLLDGVYQRGPLYLRGLQRLSSLMFGTQWGRNITLYAALPYGVAFMAIRGAEHLVEMFRSATGQNEAAHSQAVTKTPAENTRAGSTEESTETVTEDNAETNTETADAAVAEETPSVEVPAAESGEATAVETSVVAASGENATDVSLDPPAAEEQTTALTTSRFLPGSVSHQKHHEILSSQDLGFSVFLLGTIIFVLMHFPNIRELLVRVLRILWTIVRWTLYDMPVAVMKFPPVAWLMRSLPMMLFRRYFLTPIVLTAIYWKLLPGLGLTPAPSKTLVIAFFSLTIAVFLSRFGRDTEELFWDWIGKTWYRVRVHLIIGMFTLIIDVFRQIMDGLERLLYAVDEWLRFRKGESNLTLAIKAVMGAIWSVIHAIVRFAVTLLIEPQINPIKHFPVVTVSHKLLVFTIPHVAYLLSNFVGSAMAGTVATLIITSIPGVFGFLAWEFKENWKLYTANRPPKLRPALIGSHGETLLRLLCPGFHSGTIPKIFAKRRRNARKSRFRPERDRRAKFDEQLHHVAESLRHFFEREFLSLLRQSRAFGSVELHISSLRLSTNRMVITINNADSDQPMEIIISEQSGWLIAGISQLGWAGDHIDERQRHVLHTALAGLYKLGGIELIREQIESQFIDPETAYDIAETGMITWPHRDFEKEITYSLEERPITNPRPRGAARAAGLGPLPLSDLVFREHDVKWVDWQEYWETERGNQTINELLEIRLLPMKPNH